MNCRKPLACALLLAGVVTTSASCGWMMTGMVALLHQPEMTVKPKIELRALRVAVLPFSSSSYKQIPPFQCKEGMILAQEVEKRLQEKVKEIKIVPVQPARSYCESVPSGEVDYGQIAAILDCDVVIYGDILRVENQMGLDQIETQIQVWAHDARDNTRPVNEEIQAKYPEIGTYRREEMDDQERLVRNVMRACGRAVATLFYKHKRKRPVGTRELIRPELK